MLYMYFVLFVDCELFFVSMSEAVALIVIFQVRQTLVIAQENGKYLRPDQMHLAPRDFCTYIHGQSNADPIYPNLMPSNLRLKVFFRHHTLRSDHSFLQHINPPLQPKNPTIIGLRIQAPFLLRER